MSEFLVIISLFFGCFLAATIVPFPSEVLFVIALKTSGLPAEILLITASLGNTLGGLTGYWLGTLGKWQWLEKYFRISHNKVESLRHISDKYGYWLAFFCWLPWVGDLLCVVLGFFRSKFWPVTALMFTGKFARYAVLAFILE